MLTKIRKNILRVVKIMENQSKHNATAILTQIICKKNIQKIVTKYENDFYD